jgi:hypothetical protein
MNWGIAGESIRCYCFIFGRIFEDVHRATGAGNLGVKITGHKMATG